MLTIIKDENQEIRFTYTQNRPIIQGEAAQDFLNELAITIDSVLRQAKTKITGLDADKAWDMLYNCVKSVSYSTPARRKTDAPHNKEQKKMEFNYFVQYSDLIVPGIYNEIEEKYGKETLARSITRGDLAASAHEKVLDCAWMYINAKNELNEELMFACAKQLIAARNNENLIGAVLDEVK